MIKYYQLSNGTLTQSTSLSLETSQVIALSKPTKAEIAQLCEQVDLDTMIFSACESPEEVSQFSQLTSKALSDPYLLIYYDFVAARKEIEDQLAPVVIVFDQRHLIICGEFADDYVTALSGGQQQIIAIVLQLIAVSEQRLMAGVRKYKPIIDELDKASQRTIENTELRRLTDLTRCLVYFEHTMNDQKTTLDAFLSSGLVSDVDGQLILDLQTQQRRLTKKIHIYRDLLESISGLFMAMMENNLNHLMKYLDSAALVVAIPALITGLYGMNVGGLPWKDSSYGFLMVVILAVLLAIVVAILLKRKQYS